MLITIYRLAFPDESGVNANLTRRYGRAFGKERVTETLIAAVKEALKEITPEDCQGWFRKAGYR